MEACRICFLLLEIIDCFWFSGYIRHIINGNIVFCFRNAQRVTNIPFIIKFLLGKAGLADWILIYA